MLRLILIIGISIPCSTAGVQCIDDTHCDVDYYCEQDYSCRKCLRCDVDFKRASPFIATKCVKSMEDCGAYLETNNPSSSNVNDIPLKPRGSDGPVPMYAWILLALFLVAVISGATLITWINKVTYATVPRSEIQIPPGARDHVENACPPPPYSTVIGRANNAEGEALYVKPETFKPLDSSRESADRQATQPFSPPNYVRRPRTPPRFTYDQVAISDIEDQSSVDGVINVPPVPSVNDALVTATVRNQNLEGCPNIVSSGSNQSIEPSLPDNSTERARGGPPVVVVNNNVHLQSVSLSGASIFIPQSSTQVERR